MLQSLVILIAVLSSPASGPALMFLSMITLVLAVAVLAITTLVLTVAIVVLMERRVDHQAVRFA